MKDVLPARHRFLRAAAVAVASLLVLSAGAPAPARHALLMANGDYRHFGKLPNPVPEARLLRDTLASLGFGVVLVENAGREQMLDALADFEATLRREGGVALFHYGGHGVQVAGTNYLIPVDAEIPDERRVATRAVDVNEIMASLDASGAATSIVILDACRNNPLPASASRSATRGLSVVSVKPRNSIIVYAAESNTEAMDGVFTPTLAEYLGKPGLSLGEVMTEVRKEVFRKTNGEQIPGEYNQLFEQVYLAGPPAAGGTTAAGGAGTTASTGPTIGTVTVATGSLTVTLAADGVVTLLGRSISVPAGGSLPVNDVPAGDVAVKVTWPDGRTETRTAAVEKGRTAVIAFGAPTTAAAHGTEKTYAVGDRGPAGGIVFFDRGEYRDGWRYLEAAPTDQASDQAWSDSKEEVGGTDLAVGFGAANTRAIVAKLGTARSAASICDRMTLAGFDDWFLPSREELALMYQARQAIGNLKYYYWSSSEDGAENAWTMTVTTGRWYSQPKDWIHVVRAIRAF